MESPVNWGLFDFGEDALTVTIESRVTMPAFRWKRLRPKSGERRSPKRHIATPPPSTAAPMPAPMIDETSDYTCARSNTAARGAQTCGLAHNYGLLRIR